MKYVNSSFNSIQKPFFGLIFTCTLLLTSWLQVCAQVGGQVFEDLPVNGNSSNTYGVKNTNELGVDGVVVTITDASGNVTTQTTASGGTWSDPASNFPIRVEFSWPNHSWLESSAHGPGANSSVQFISASSTNIDFGLHYPSNFCESDPNIAIPMYSNGDPTAGGTSGTRDWFLNFAYSNSGEIGGSGYVPPSIRMNGTTIGAVWGLAYHNTTESVLAGALMKRHAGFGSGGTGAIYRITSSGVPSLFLDLNSFPGVNAGSDTRVGSDPNNSLPANYNVASRDIDAFQAVGKVGLGDLELSDDNSVLYATNLNQGTLHEIPVGNNLTAPASINTYDIVGALDNLVNGTAIACGDVSDYRPWGLKFHQGFLYVGVVCSAELSRNPADLHAYVLRFDPSNPGAGFSLFLDLSLDYAREPAFQSDVPSQTIPGAWRPWARDHNDVTTLPWLGAASPTPILADIEIDVDGSMILGILDRYGMQSGFRQFSTDLSSTSFLHQGMSAGDVLRFCNVNGVLVQEGNAACAFNPSPPWSNPGLFVPQGEFYSHEEFFSNTTNPNHGHPETAIGSLAFLPGSNEIASTAIDPFALRSGGVAFWSNQDGSVQHEYELYETVNGSIPDGTFSKASGLGDIELMCSPAPIEIGNYVWEDTDMDGIQDPGENALSGIQVELLLGNTVIATATTDANGNYIFSNDPNGSSSGSHIYNIGQLEANMSYTVRFPTTSGSLMLTSANAGSKDIIDSDANASGEITVLTTDIPMVGANNHSFDVGYFTQQMTEPCVGTYVLDFEDPNWNSGTGFTEGSDASGLPNQSIQTISNFQGSGIDITVEFDGQLENTSDFSPPNIYTSNTWNFPYDNALRWANRRTTGTDAYNYVIVSFSQPVELNTIYSTNLKQFSGSNAEESATFEIFDGPGATGNKLAIPGGTASVSLVDPEPVNNYVSDLPEVSYSNNTLTLIADRGTDQGGAIDFGSTRIRSFRWGLVMLDQTTGNPTDAFRSSQAIDNICFNASSCSLTADGKTNETCDDNGSASNPTDDYVSFTLDPTGDNLGTAYTVTVNNGGTISPTSASYGNPTNFQLQNGSADGTLYTITITDNSDANCSITTTVQQSPCSNSCNLSDAGESNETCDDNGSASNAADDFISFSLDPSGVNLGTGYTVTVNNVGTISPTSGSYGNPTNFQLQNGSANGTLYTITITDNSDANCSITTTVQQFPCSDCPDTNCLDVEVEIIEN